LKAERGQPDSDWKQGFLFVGNNLVLDFLNTRPVQNGETQELLPDFPALVRWFQAAGLLTPADAASIRERWGNSDRGRQTVLAARELRERLRKEILAWEAGADLRRSTIDELNRLMAEHPMRIRIRASQSTLSKEGWFRKDEPGDLLAPLAQGAAVLFTDIDRERIRKCGECVLHFHDTSKKGTRRWCSMRLCGNRLKVAAYAARQRKN
jgi:predicted RNA-binding Zn ribbon-like protein